MAKPIVHLAIFPEESIDEVGVALDALRDLGVKEKQISVISGAPYSDKMLGRPMQWTRVPYVALAGAVAGFLIALFLNFGTPLLYPVRVGGMAHAATPPAFVLQFELTMLGMLVSTFIGVAVEMVTPTYGPKGYDARISDGKIGILFESGYELDGQLHEKLSQLGAEIVHGAEDKKLWLF